MDSEEDDEEARLANEAFSLGMKHLDRMLEAVDGESEGEAGEEEEGVGEEEEEGTDLDEAEDQGEEEDSMGDDGDDEDEADDDDLDGNLAFASSTLPIPALDYTEQGSLAQAELQLLTATKRRDESEARALELERVLQKQQEDLLLLREEALLKREEEMRQREEELAQHLSLIHISEPTRPY